jgi:hypothetical protein
MGVDASPNAAKKAKLLSAYRSIAPIIGAFGLLNIYAHADTFTLLSKSVIWLVGWYHHFTGQLFALLPFHIPVLARDILVIYIMLSTAAARGRGKVMITPVAVALIEFRFLGKTYRYYDRMENTFIREGSRKGVGVSSPWWSMLSHSGMGLVTAYVLSAIHSPKYVLFIIIFCFAITRIFTQDFSPSLFYMKNVPKLVRYVISLLALPAGILSTHMYLFQSYFLVMAKTLIVFVGLLVMNYLFASHFEPFISWIGELPQPPATS